MQEFDAASLARTDDLGQRLNFSDAVPHAKRLIDRYNRLSVSVIADFPENLLEQLKNIANADYSRFKEILDFSEEQNNPRQVRDALSEQLRVSYDATFQQLWLFIAYGVSKTIDSQRLENESRAVLQSIQDQATTVTSALKKDKETSASILGDIRKVAAEHGVTQQASYFKSEADQHEIHATTWESATKRWAGITMAAAFTSLFFHKIPWIAPENSFDAAQLITSKILIFTVLGYVILLSGKNFLAHKHNAVVNRHRQNALLTYKAISDAAKAPDKQDTILAQAANCIFSPQDTGYQRKSSSNDSPAVSKTVIDLVSKVVTKGE